MSTFRFSHPQKAMRKARLDNIALVPASLLPHKQQYQALANQLPRGTVLVIDSGKRSTLSDFIKRLAVSLSASGRPVKLLRVSHSLKHAL